MESIFLTGGTGFIGSHLLNILLEEDEDVTTLTRSERKGEKLEEMGAKAIVGDLRNEKLLLENIQEHGIVFHLGALYNFGGISWSKFYSTNVLGTKNVLECAEERGARVIYCSTVAHFGSTEGEVRNEDFTRTTPYSSRYAKSKTLAHNLCLKHIKGGGDIIIISPGAVFGEGDTSQIGGTIRSYLKGNSIFLPDTEGRFTFVHVDDVAKALLLALKNGQRGREYIIGDKIMTMKGFFAKICEEADLPPPPTIPFKIAKIFSHASEIVAEISGRTPKFSMEALRTLKYDWAFSSERAREELGWRPKPFEERLTEYVTTLQNKF